MSLYQNGNSSIGNVNVIYWTDESNIYKTKLNSKENMLSDHRIDREMTVMSISIISVKGYYKDLHPTYEAYFVAKSLLVLSRML